MAEAPTRVCIVGAGAVALVYARYLQNAGAEVSLLVKPQYRDFCRKGFQLHHFGYRGGIRDERLVVSSILTRVDEVAEGAFDQIWLTVASDALRLYRALQLRDLARIDFRLDPERGHFLLEANTIPGLTATSLLPMGAAALGMDFPTLCERLCRAAFDRGADLS